MVENGEKEKTMPTVLIAKENKDVCFMISETLRFYVGCDAIAAANGTELLRMAKDEASDVILLDIYVPGMEGFEAYERLKNDEETRFIPVIFLVHHHDDLKGKIQDREVGTYDYLIEPFNNLELITRVKVMLRFKELIDKVEGHLPSVDGNEYWRLQMARIDERLRTYLNPIMGLTALLLETGEYGPLTAKQKKFIDLIHRNGEKMLRITDESMGKGPS